MKEIAHLQYQEKHIKKKNLGTRNIQGLCEGNFKTLVRIVKKKKDLEK